MEKQLKLIVKFTFSLLLITVVSCKSFKNEGSGDFVTCNFILDPATNTVKTGEQFNSLSSSPTESAFVIAVPDSTTWLNRFKYLKDNYYDQKMLDTSDNTVSMLLPLNTPLRIIEVAFASGYSKDTIISSKPTASLVGVSDTFTVDHSKEEMTIPIALGYGNSVFGIGIFGTDVFEE